jgi:hypothetical protein
LSVHSKKRRISSGGIMAGLSAAALLVLSIGAATGSAAVTVAPANTELPSISGTPKVGQTLTASDGTWANAPTSFSYIWLRCQKDGKKCSTIPSATAKTYVLAAADEKQAIRVRVTATNADGSTAAESKQTGAVGAAPGGGAGVPANTSAPTITGLAKVGQTLVAAEGKWSNRPTGYTFAWQRCATDAGSCVNIAGATGKSYAVTSASIGNRLRVMVTAKNAKGTASASSALTAVVAGIVKNQRPAIAILSARFVGPTIFVRFRVCDDSRKNLTILATDSRPGVASYTRRFTTVIAPKPCGAYTRHWTPVARFRHGKVTVSLRARDKSGLTSLAARRTFNR